MFKLGNGGPTDMGICQLISIWSKMDKLCKMDLITLDIDNLKP